MTDSFAAAPLIRGLADIEAIENRPFAQQAGFSDTYGLFARSASRFGDRLALIHLPSASAKDAIRFSYHALFGRITQAANLFHSLGVRPGKAVSYLLPSLPETHFTLWGAEAAGIANPLNPLLSVDHLADLMNVLESQVLVAPAPALDPTLWDKATAVRQRVASLRTVLTVGGAARGAIPFEAALEGFPADRLISKRSIKPDDVASAFHTGGTTGAPKLAPHTHLNEAHAAWGGALLAGYVEDDVMLNGMPLFHVGGAIIASLSVFATGGAVAILTPAGMRNSEVAANYWRIAEDLGATVVGGVPTVIATLGGVDPAGANLSAVRYAISGAAPLPRAAAETFARTSGTPVREMLGMTETGGVLSVSPRHGPQRPGSAGLRLPYEQVLVRRVEQVNDPTGDCAPDEAGVLLVRGPNVFPGYINPDHNKAAFTTDGWFVTGDLARVSADGYVTVTGRSKDLIIRGGHNIDPAVIEEAATAHPAVLLAAAVGAPDRYAGEVPMLFVVLAPEAGLQIDELRAFIADRIAERPALPREVVQLDALPTTGVGKIFKPELRRRAAERVLRAEMADLFAQGDVADLVVGLDASSGLTVTVGLTQACGTNTASELELRLGGYLFPSRVLTGADTRR